MSEANVWIWVTALFIVYALGWTVGKRLALRQRRRDGTP